jgi:hypothetical protein
MTVLLLVLLIDNFVHMQIIYGNKFPTLQYLKLGFFKSSIKRI